MKRSALVLAVMVGLMVVASAMGVVVHDARYRVETVAAIEMWGVKPIQYMTFAGDGNLYATHFDADDRHSDGGFVSRISLDGTATTLCTGLYRPFDIVWGGGTAFGNYLYVAEGSNFNNWDKGQVTQIGLDGSKTDFCGDDLNQPVSLALAPEGPYNSALYIGSGAHDRISRSDPSGNSVRFSDFPSSFGVEDTPVDMVFHNGTLCIAMEGYRTPNYSGLFTMYSNGNALRFAPSIIEAWRLASDTTADQNFDGKLFVAGREGDRSRYIFAVNSDNSTSLFAEASIPSRLTMAFGPDGAMYTAEYNYDTNVATVSRIELIPEPATALLLLGTIPALRRRR